MTNTTNPQSPPQINWDQMKGFVEPKEIIQLMEDGFVAYSQGKAVIPPVGELLFENPPGETHIKYGYIKGDEYFVIKVASGFPANSDLGLSNSQGMMLLFSQETGIIEAILLDNGRLTDIRTAAAGALVARYFAPTGIDRIGVLGTGIQAGLQVEYFQEIMECKSIYVWGRNKDKCRVFLKKMDSIGFSVHICETPSEVAQSCKFIITTTASKKPLLHFADIIPGTHITAMGSDTEEKIELDPEILANADLVVSDSIPQSHSRGEVYQAVKAGQLDRGGVIELGDAIQKGKTRTGKHQVTIVDLTGVAVQDIQIARSVYLKYLASRKNKL